MRVKRAVVKSISWRLLGIAMLIIISFMVTGSWYETAIIAFIFHALRTVLYVFHELLWEKIWP